MQENTTFSADFRIAKSYGGTPQNAFVQGGNAFETSAILGTLDNQPVELYANNTRGLRFEPNATSPNWIAGYAANGVYLGTVGETVAGGGAPGSTGTRLLDAANCVLAYGCINGVLDSFGTIGGAGNLAGAGTSGVAGAFATVAGGASNWAYSVRSTIAGGYGNTASGDTSTVAGGYHNTASGTFSSVLGGADNVASGSTATALGGPDNVAAGYGSLAGGTNAIANLQGMFVWADTDIVHAFDPTAPPAGWANGTNTFNVRARGGFWFVTGTDPSGTPTWGCTLTNGSACSAPAIET